MGSDSNEVSKEPAVTLGKGVTRMFGVLYAAEGSAAEVLYAVAREYSPRIEVVGPREVTLDLGGLTRIFGDARAMGEAIGRTAAERGLRLRIALAGTRTAAHLLAHAALDPLTLVEPGEEAVALAGLPVALLAAFAADESAPSHPHPRAPLYGGDVLSTFRRWGLRTLGDVAGLPADAVAARLGQDGVRWQRLARGEDPRPLVPVVDEERFEQSLELEWPIEGLEPLSFVLGRLMEPLSAQLERRGRGAATLHVRLHLVTRVVHARTLQLPAPMRDARTLRTLALLDLESHPPSAAIDRVWVAVDPTPARPLQYSLLTRPLPSPETISTLMARLTALMGEGRCGSPVAVDSWEPGAFAIQPFAPADIASSHPAPAHLRTLAPSHTESSHFAPSHPELSPLCPADAAVALRRFRFPVPARVQVEAGRPSRVVLDRVAIRTDAPSRDAPSVHPDRTNGAVTQCAGPWRTAGHWWTEEAWDRDEWDVTVNGNGVYRIFRDRRTDAWFLEGVVD